MTTYNLQSANMMHAPGIVRWAMAGYQIDNDPKMVTLVAKGWNIPAKVVKKLLSGKVQWTEKDGNVTFTV
jgi:hypothetical protein